MPVDTQHDDYAKRISHWETLKDVIEGEAAVKARGEYYLPKLSGADDVEYDAYRRRAVFYNATARTVEGLAGAIQRKTYTIDFPERHKERLGSISNTADSLDEIVSIVLDRVIAVGRIGLLVDDDETANVNPFIAIYHAENITNWETKVIGGREVLTRVHLREQYKVVGKDEFDSEPRDRYRLLRLGVGTGDALNPDFDPETVDPEDLVYYQEVYEKKRTESSGARDQWTVVRTIVPEMQGGRRLSEIPFIVINPTRTGIRPQKPPLLDMASVNLSLYRNSADYEHGLHYTALPTPWAAGFDIDKGEMGGTPNQLKLGSMAAWVSKDPRAQAGMLEFTGKGLGQIAQAMEDKKREMAVMGARLLEEQKRSAEAEATVKLRHAGEQSVLARISMTCSAGLTQVLQILADWLAVSGWQNVKIELNKDFNIVGLSFQELTALVGAVQAGMLSFDSYFYNMKRGEMIPETRTLEEEIELIQHGLPGAVPPEEDPEPED